MSQAKRIRRSLQQMETSSLSTIADFPEPLRMALAYWSALRKFGFDADDIFFGFGTVSGIPDAVHIALITQGKSFVLVALRMPGMPKAHVESLWRKLAAVVHTSENEERDANYREFLDGDAFLAIGVAIREKGIYLPELVHMEPTVGSA